MFISQSHSLLEGVAGPLLLIPIVLTRIEDSTERSVGPKAERRQKLTSGLGWPVMLGHTQGVGGRDAVLPSWGWKNPLRKISEGLGS